MHKTINVVLSVRKLPKTNDMFKTEKFYTDSHSDSWQTLWVDKRKKSFQHNPGHL